jgi:hypothetical protein
MHRRLLYCLLAASLLLPNTGCFFLHGLKCCMRKCRCAIAERTYCGDGCGEKYWTEWAADPPACCEPCNNCGEYVGCRRNPWVGPKKGCPNCYPCNEGATHAGHDEVYSDF